MKIKKIMGVRQILIGLCLYMAQLVCTGYSPAYAQDGVLDVDFDTDGLLTTAVGTVQDQGLAVAIQSDQKLVVAGFTYVGTDSDFAICRYNTDGSLDASFGTGGKVTVDFMGQADEASSVLIQADGKIVVGGKTFDGTDEDFALIRLNTNGTMDNTFGGMGYMVTNFFGGDESITGLALQADQKIVACGNIFNGTKDFAVARYTTAGLLDITFDGDGKVTTDFAGSNEVCHGIALQPDGKIVLTGATYVGANSDFGLIRYNTDGSLDIGFDGDGKVITDIANDHDSGIDLVVKDGTKLVVVGNSVVAVDKTSFAILQYNLDGTLDNTFSTDGIFVTGVETYTGVGYTDETAHKVAVQSDGKLVVGGYSHFNYTNYNFALVRVNADGSLDTSFDFDGQLTTNFSGTSTDVIQDLAIQSDGKIVAAGYSDLTFALARYAMETCSLNASASLNGTSINADQTGLAYQWLDCGNGYAVVAGETAENFSPSVNGSYAVEINDNGCIDTSDCILINSLGFSQSNNENDISYFPNPAKNQVVISAADLITGLEVYDLSGKLMLSQKKIGATTYALDLTAQDAGIYIVRIYCDDQVFNFKLVNE